MALPKGNASNGAPMVMGMVNPMPIMMGGAVMGGMMPGTAGIVPGTAGMMPGQVPGGLMLGAGSLGMPTLPMMPMVTDASQMMQMWQAMASMGGSNVVAHMRTQAASLPATRVMTSQEPPSDDVILKEDSDSTIKRVFAGMAMNYDVDRKSGFIFCEEIRKKHKTDVYYYKNVMDPSGAGVGDNVCFVLHISPAGRPQASLPLLRLSTPGDFAMAGTFVTAPTGGGVLECDEINLIFGREAFVPPELASRFKPGDRVAFNSYLGRDGFPIVQDGQVVDLTWNPTRASLQTSLCMPGYKRPGNKGGPAPMPVEATGTVPVELPSSLGVQKERPKIRMPGGRDKVEYVGHVYIMCPGGKYGFIKCPEFCGRYGEDAHVFVHENQMNGKGLRKGMKIKFKAALNWEDKPAAEWAEMVEDAPSDMEFEEQRPRHALTKQMLRDVETVKRLKAAVTPKALHGPVTRTSTIVPPPKVWGAGAAVVPPPSWAPRGQSGDDLASVSAKCGMPRPAAEEGTEKRQRQQ